MSSGESIDELTSRNVKTIAQIEGVLGARRSCGERYADLIADSIGSWKFILIQAALLFVWMALNIEGWVHHWDPFPFILLNLALSFQAAFAGPIIMMSQNRQSRLAERRNQLDLQINLLAEQETTEMLRPLRLLCKKAGVADEQVSRTDPFVQDTKPDHLLKEIEKATPNPPKLSGP